MIGMIRQGLKDDGYTVSISRLCRWFEVPRRTVYYRPTRKLPTVQERFCQPIKQMIEENPSFGYRTVAHLLSFNKNTVQRIFQLMRWQVKKRPVGSDLECGPCLRWRVLQMSAGRQICVVYGADGTAGPRLPSSWAVIAVSSWGGICPAADDPKPRNQLWNRL